MYQAKISVTLRQAILDVQGKTVEHALHSLGYTAVDHVRMGKFITLNIGTDDAVEAKRVANEACVKLLSNPIIEDYTVELVKS
jgi:phosphoribosylformylglycinamidine synthase